MYHDIWDVLRYIHIYKPKNGAHIASVSTAGNLGLGIAAQSTPWLAVEQFLGNGHQSLVGTMGYQGSHMMP
jgi:hypothetical protein